ncbi:hypothetical protein ACFSSA_08265 [Luteolibacter algae]|uniref:DUF4175 domain-containing protein n=1 Tax=Luteolibacter algae TaxID=454151 RepID=A0ABW5D719_9BACT
MRAESKQQAFWVQRAKKLSHRINFAWFLQTLSAPLLITAALGAVITLAIRREMPAMPPLYIGLGLGCVIFAVALICLRLAWSRFESVAQALVRIEADSGMNNALSTANCGLIDWPEPPNHRIESLGWHLPRAIIPPVGALALLALGLFIPISAKPDETPPPSREPQAWSQIDSQLEQLAEDAAVDSEYLEEMQKRLDQLRSQEEEDWFSHASLEATDSLEQTQNSNVEDLQKNVSEAENALEELGENPEQMSGEQKQKLAEDFESALEAIQNGAMKPNPELLDQLSNLDPENLGKLSPEQLSQLKEGMKKLRESLEKSGVGENGDWSEELLGEGGENGEGESRSGGKEGAEGYGSGGIQRGPGHDPNVLGDEKEALDTGELTGLEAKDLSKAMPGDLLQLQDGKHSVDEDPTAPVEGGEGSRGKGGDRVWKDSLAPDEQRALKKYFE